MKSRRPVAVRVAQFAIDGIPVTIKQRGRKFDVMAGREELTGYRTMHDALVAGEQAALAQREGPLGAALRELAP
jgi:hypothetical protein